MIVESITGPDDFTIGTKLVYHHSITDLMNNRSYSLYEVSSLPDYDGRIQFATYEQYPDGSTSTRYSQRYRVDDFRPLMNWRKITEFMPYDPNQQGDTEDDI